MFELREAALFFGFFGTLAYLFRTFDISLVVMLPAGTALYYLADVSTVRLARAKSYGRLLGYKAESR